MIKRIHHLAVAVRSVDEAAETYGRYYGIEFSPAEDVPTASIKRRMADIGGVIVELVQPLQDGDAISTFLERKGEGLYLLSFAVDSVPEARRRVDDGGARVISQQTSPTTGLPLMTIHPRDNHGVLIQLTEDEAHN